MVVEFEQGGYEGGMFLGGCGILMGGGGTKEACFRWLWNLNGGVRRRHVIGGCGI